MEIYSQESVSEWVDGNELRGNIKGNGGSD